MPKGIRIPRQVRPFGSFEARRNREGLLGRAVRMNSGPGIVTLTTDFGLSGPYVAAMKGIVLGQVPGAQVVDVSHTISPQNVLEGAFVLAAIVDAFPAGTVHLAVIDPGVGTERRLIAVALADQWFVLPDNGLITGIASGRVPTGIWQITNPTISPPSIAPTFHGRDILAPAAAHLLLGRDPAELGPVRTRFITLRNFQPDVNPNGLVGEVLFRDAFGNLITNIAGGRLGDEPSREWFVEIAGSRLDGLVRTYGESPAGTLVALIGSSGWLEVAVVNGDASKRLDVGAGATVWLRRKTGLDRARPE
jgi:S-adenosyl-L-methionine hydrolase (adenosine-forming)